MARYRELVERETGLKTRPTVFVDTFGRPVTNVRLSVNSSNHCNFRCIFCHMEGVRNQGENLISPVEIERIIRVMSSYGVDSVKITGGEPMLRQDIVEIVERLGGIGLRDISMTTNGTSLADLAWELKAKGLNRVNVNLPSLRRERYALITGVDRLIKTLAAVETAVEAGLLPVKLNMVLLKGVNEDEVWKMVAFSRKLGGWETNILQLIELVESDDEFYHRFHINLGKIEGELSRRAISVRKRILHGRLQHNLPEGVTVEVVKPVHNSTFCMSDNRIRITHDGKFKPCLYREDNHIDFLTAMRAGVGDGELSDIFKRAVLKRAPYHKHT